MLLVGFDFDVLRLTFRFCIYDCLDLVIFVCLFPVVLVCLSCWVLKAGLLLERLFGLR